MRPIFDKVSRDAAGFLLLNTGGLLTEASDRIITEDSDALNQERGKRRFLGWATDGGAQRFVTTNTPSNPTLSEGVAYDSDGAMHVSLAAPSSALIHEGIAHSSAGAIHLFDLSATLLTEASATITTEADEPIVAESAAAFIFSGIPVTSTGQICYS